jgi:hypothetical protein
MDSEEFFKSIGFVVFCILFGLAIVYYFGQCMSLQTSIIEGLENKDESVAKAATPTQSNIAGGTIASIDAIKAETVKMMDMLLIDKYKDDYIKKIIALDDYFDMVILATALQISPGSSSGGGMTDQLIKNMTMLKAGREALNDAMKTLDKSSGSTTTSSLGF